MADDNDLQYPFDTAPEAGSALRVADGVRWLRMPLPFALTHINLWLVRDDDGWAIVDTGVHLPDTVAAWERVNDELLDGRGPTRVFVTHMHPDHVGMAGWLCARFGIELWMTRGEYYTCRVLAADTGREAPAAGVAFYTACGWSDDDIARYRKTFGMFGRAVSPLPEAYRRLQDGQRLLFGGATYQVLMGNGHSPEHACLYDERANVLISGDQILPTISSNVGVWPTEPEANPLRDWLASCRRLRTRLPDDVLVLPAHGKPFRGARQRLTALIDEHERGLERLLALCAEPRRACDVFGALFKGRITGSNLIMATGEAVAHLNWLRAEGALRRRTDDDGVHWYERAAGQA